MNKLGLVVIDSWLINAIYKTSDRKKHDQALG